MRLATKNIRLIPKEQCHALHIYRWFYSGDYADFFGNIPMITTEGATSFNRAGSTFMIVNASKPDEVIGVCVINNIEERNRNLHYGLLIDKQYQGKKLAKEASLLMLYYIMNSMNFYKVIARVSPENDASKRLTESFGFELEGILKQELYIDGEFHDLLRYRITKGVFNKKFKQAVESSEKELVG